ncbi:glycohydrolase toxin TNT-related protein [Chloroflexota bacterium]
MALLEWDNTFDSINNDYTRSVCEAIDNDGYIMVGYTQADVAGDTDAWMIKTDKEGNELWKQTFGGPNDDYAYSVSPTDDGGYIIAGQTNSDAWLIKTLADGSPDTNFGNNGEKTFHRAANDYANDAQQTFDQQGNPTGYIIAGYSGGDAWLIKTDVNGNKDNTFSNDGEWASDGSGTDEAFAVQQTSDGGYIIAGCTSSYSTGGYDAWLLKIDANGAVANGWTEDDGKIGRTFGDAGVLADGAQDVEQTFDQQGNPSGYIIVGNTYTYGSGGWSDVWLIKTDANGSSDETLGHGWERAYGGSANDFGQSVSQTSDGGYIIAGYSQSFGDGDTDAYLIKTDANGSSDETLGHGWERNFGGGNNDYAYSACQTNDGGYIMAGRTISSASGDYDAWLISTDGNGNSEEDVSGWMKTVDGTGEEYNDEFYSTIETSDGGYIMAGRTYSTETDSYDVWLRKVDARGEEEWSQTHDRYGWDDCARSVYQTVDGGYIIAGYTYCTYFYGEDNYDILLIKTNKYGEINGETDGNTGWIETYGDPGYVNNYAYSVCQNNNGDYLVAGYTYTDTDGYSAWLRTIDASGTEQPVKNFADSSYDVALSVSPTSDGGCIIAGCTFNNGIYSYDVRLIKMDSSGTIEWDYMYGSALTECAYSVSQTSDDGYIVAGYFASGNNTQAWLMKTNKYGEIDGATDGNIGWIEIFGGNDVNDRAFSAKQTSDGGYIVAGHTYSATAGGSDAWLVKMVDHGDNRAIIMDKTFGGADEDCAYSVCQTSDGGYIVAGYADYSNSTDNPSDSDALLIKTDSGGNIVQIWQNTFDSTYNDYTRSVCEASDGGYIMAGFTLPGGAGYGDAWLIKTDTSGNELWRQTYGGPYNDFAFSVSPTVSLSGDDDGYIIGGYTYSYETAADFWLIKTDIDGNKVWEETYGSGGYECAYSASQTSDGGYIIAGHKYDSGDQNVWLVKTDEEGNYQWDETHGGSDNDSAQFVSQTSDDGYIIAGLTKSFGDPDGDAYLVKTYPDGTLEWENNFGGTAYDYANSVSQTSDGGYIVAGYTASYGNGGDAWLIKTDADGNVATGWEPEGKTYGGSSHDEAVSVSQTTPDGGYIIAGYTFSPDSGDYDALLIKTDASGSAEEEDGGWMKTFGGTSHDYAYSVCQTNDGGYIMAGRTISSASGDYDAWLIKLTYDKRWSKTFGGNGTDQANSICQTNDGGYIVAGHTVSPDDGSNDFWLMKTDASGEKQWEKTYGGDGDDKAFSVIQTADGGYIVAGYSCSDGPGLLNTWLIKIEANTQGEIEWQKYHGGENSDYAYSVCQTSDGGYIVAGRSNSDGHIGSYDIWLLKTWVDGSKDWERFIGGTGYDYGTSVIETSDGYIVTGFIESNVANKYDARLIKIKANTEGQVIEWEKTIGGENSDYSYIAESVSQTSDGGYIVAGYTADSAISAGNYDFWLVKTDVTGEKIWEKTYGGYEAERAYSVYQTADHGYIVAGESYSYGAGSYDIWLVKTDFRGDKEWSRTFGDIGKDQAYSVSQTSDGGYIVAGRKDSCGANEYDAWLIKLPEDKKQWSQTFGGTGTAQANDICQTNDGGYIIAGSIDGDICLIKTKADGSADETFGNNGKITYGGALTDVAYDVQQISDGYIVAGCINNDAYLIKTDSAGNMEPGWPKSFGGGGSDEARAVQQTSDGGYILAGRTASYGGGYKAWIIKTDSGGTEQWRRLYGGSLTDVAYDVQQISDGYIVAGSTESFSNNGSGGWSDAWLIKMNDEGDKEWESVFGGPECDCARSVCQTSDGGYILAGCTSDDTGDYDAWLIKVPPFVSTEPTTSYSYQELYTPAPMASTFVYDGDGNRVLKNEGGETILYVNPYYEINLTTGEETTHYYLGGREIAFKKDDGITETLTYVHQDHLGSTTQTTDSSGNEIADTSYFPYGNRLESQGDLATDRLFTGQRLDDTGLYFYNARYYDSTIGRFISADTIVPDFSNPQAFNRYSYCYNNPTTYIDPDGHLPIIGVIILGVALGAGGYTAGTAIDNTVNGRSWHEGWNAWDCATWATLGGVSGGLLSSSSFVASVGGRTIAPFLVNTVVTEVGYGISAGRKGEWSWEGALLTGGISVGVTGAGVAAGRAWSSLRGGNGYPPNKGALGKWSKKVLDVGDEIDRYGPEKGRHASPFSTPKAMRSLPPSSANASYYAYRVLKQLKVKECIIAPWFGEPGLGTGYYLPKTINKLIKKEYLERITGP